MTEAPHILLIDDDEDTFIIVRRLLSSAEGAQYALDWASTYEEGSAKIGNTTYAAVLLDYRLGARDGLELLDEALACGVDVPVIVLTGQGGREIDLDAMRRGAAEYLAKDRLETDSLERTIRYSVERHRLTSDLRQQATELASRADELERINQCLEQFVWAASHDLQTPLRTIMYRLQYLQALHDGKLEGAESIDFAVEAARRMAVLLHDLLSYVQSGSDELHRAPVDIDRLVRDILEMVSEQSPGKVTVNRETLPTVTANQSLLGQVFQNLILNAIQHSRDGDTHITIAARRGADKWEFAVEDDGAGVAPDEMEMIFDPFRRSGRSHDKTGSGIGLALCHRAIERHGGAIWCEASPSGGASFRFTIPDDAEQLEAGRYSSVQ